MKILFISLHDIESIAEHGLYSDLLREFEKNNHTITIISPVERRTGRKSQVITSNNTQIIKVRIGNIQKTNYIEKGISTVLLGSQLIRAIKKHCSNVKFDLVLYATPPVTIYSLIKRVKKVTGANTFLMLKDIWPQEMVDLNLIKPKGPVYRYFVRLEYKMYQISDLIGYTSNANKKYLLSKGIDENKLVEVNNSVDPNYKHDIESINKDILKEYGVKENSTVFFYGGNLGKPQDIDFMLECLQSQINYEDRFYVICGQGTEYSKIEHFFKINNPRNMKLFPYLPKNEYDRLIMQTDVGMVFLNHRFTVPNCPSRFYTYMEYGKAVFACTDKATDISEDITAGDFGWWCESKNVADFKRIADSICNEGKLMLAERGKKARDYLERHYTVDKDYKRIIDSLTVIKNERLD